MSSDDTALAEDARERLTLVYSVELHDEIERQIEETPLVNNASEWWRAAVNVHRTMMDFPREAEAAVDTRLPVVHGMYDGEGERVETRRTSLNVTSASMAWADDAVERGIADSVSDYFRAAAYSYLAFQQVARNAGAHEVFPDE